MTLYLQEIRGYSALLAGVALLPQMAMAVVGSTVSGWIAARTGPRLPMLIGLRSRRCWPAGAHRGRRP